MNEINSSAIAVVDRRRNWNLSGRHQWINTWLTATGEPLRSVVTLATQAVRDWEVTSGERKNRRRAIDEANFERLIEGLIANLAYAVLMPPPTGLLCRTTGSKTISRYESRAFGPKPQRNAIRALDSLGWLESGWVGGRGEASVFRPGNKLAALVREKSVGLGDFGRDSEQEVVILSSNAESRDGLRKKKTLLPYDDNATTRRYRQAVRSINSYTEQANITFIDDGAEPAVDPYDRRLTRRFGMPSDREEALPRFDMVGRLAGGFWMSLKRARRDNIRIDGEPVATLDYSSMFTRLAFAELGEPQPTGDVYAIPGAERYRDGVKAVMNCFLFDQHSRRSKWPAEFIVGGDVNAKQSEDEKRLPEGWTVAKARAAIRAVHPALPSAWGRGLGLHLMFKESEILVAVLTELMRRGVAALGLHDGLLVAASKAEEAKQVMQAQSKAVVGAELPVSLKV